MSSWAVPICAACTAINAAIYAATGNTLNLFSAIFCGLITLACIAMDVTR